MFSNFKGFFNDNDGTPLPVKWRLFKGAAAVLSIASAVLLAMFGFPDHVTLTTVSLVLVALFAAAFFLRSTASIILACWIAVVGGLRLGYLGPIVPAVWFTMAALLFTGRRRLLRRTDGCGVWRQIFSALQMCFILLFAAENVAQWVRPIDPQAAPNATPMFENAPFSPGLPTFITLGSSPATTEISQDRPFSRVLSERLTDVANFRIAKVGGVDSEILLKIAGDAWAHTPPVDGIMLYAGFQDLNQNRMQRVFRHADVLGTSNAALASAVWLTNNTTLFRQLVEYVKHRSVTASTSENPVEARRVFNELKSNIRTLLNMARSHNTRVFVMTLVPDSKRISDVGKEYVRWVNEFYRSLPQQYPEVTVVDFAAAFAARYPEGRLADGEPFEVSIDGTGRPGDPYHLGLAGHRLLADTIEPEIRGWATKWRLAK